MEASPAPSAPQLACRGRGFDSIVDSIGDTPIVRLRELPQVYRVRESKRYLSTALFEGN